MGFGDFNGDGRLDLAASQGPEGVSLLLGRGDGTFQEPSQLDRDGGVLLRHRDGGLQRRRPPRPGRDEYRRQRPRVFFSAEGTGRFKVRSDGPQGPSLNGLVTADFNGDGRLDLAVANRSSNDVSLLLGRGDGTFQDQVRFAAGLQPWDLLTGDFNGDGRPDLAAANAQSHDFTLLLGLGDGTFEQSPAAAGRGRYPRGVVTADFNGDGRLDLATTSYPGDDVSVFLGRGDGTFHGAMRFPVGSTPVSLMTADFNGDGRLDLATVNCTSNDVSILLGRGDGTFADQGRYATGIGLEFGVAGDFNGDASLDLFVGGLFGTRGVVLLGRGDGTFAVFSERIHFTADTAVRLRRGRFNGDGRLDLAATMSTPPPFPHTWVWIPPMPARPAFRSTWAGATGPSRRRSVSPWAVRRGASSPATSTATAGSTWPRPMPAPRACRCCWAGGTGTFQDEARFSTGASSESLVAADLNGDGRLDLAVTGVSAQVTVLLGRGDGTFQDARSDSRSGISRVRTSASLPATSMATAASTWPPRRC